MRGLVSAFRILTILPIPGKESVLLSSSLPWFPVVGLALGLVLCSIAFLWTKALPTPWSAGGALILLAAQIFLTRGLHLDGLADWADALGGDRDKGLSIMKDSHVGAFGVLALTATLLAKWVFLERLLSREMILYVPAVMVVSRDMMVELMSTLPYARAGKGLAGGFMEGISPEKRVKAHALALCCCLPLGPACLLLFFPGWIIARLLGRSFEKRFGGITGDLLGATNEILEVSLMMVCATILDF